MPSEVKGDGGCADDVVVSGLSGRLPESDNIEEFAQQLFDGVDLVTADDRRWKPGMHGLPERSGKLKNLAQFDATFFGVHAKQVNSMDPQVRLLLEVTHEVIVDAGLSPAELRGSRTGVYIGVAISESEELWRLNVNKINGYGLIGCCRAMFPNWLTYAFDLKGPSYSIDSACSSSISALTQAMNAIQAGHCDAAIVAGTNLCLDPAYTLNFQRLGMLSLEGRCAAMDASGRGYVRSEAVVAILLQRRRDARRLYCTVRGARMNTDGYKLQGVTYPAGEMQRRLAQETFEEAHLLPQDVAYVEAHGTGTKVGDPEEVNAIAEFFCKNRQTPLLLGSVKSNMGHSETASGLCAIAKVILAIERGIIPGNLHFNKPNPDIPALSDGRIKVVDKNTPWQGGIVAVNSTGFGGSNAHVILESQSGVRPPTVEYSVPRLILASGRTDAAVEQLLQLAAEHQRDAELHALIDAVHAKAIPRHPRRGYAVLDPALGAAPVTEVLESEGEPRPVWFVFSGMGSQGAGMARTLLRLPAFAASIARSAAVLEPYGVDLQNVITEATDAAFDDVINCFVSVTAVQVALVDVLRELDVHPDGIIGHSLGEIGCAYADEALTAEQAVLCAYWRGRCMREAAPAPGAMAAVGLSWEQAARRCPADVELACHNSPDNVTISGPLASVKEFVEQLSAEGVFARLVNTAGVAFHSKYIAGVAPLLRARLQQLIPAPKPRSARWLSTSVPQDRWGEDIAKLSDAAYHVNNLVSPVRFAPVLPLVPGRALVVEVAPHALLQAVLKRALPGAAHVPLLRRDANDALTHMLSAFGKIYAAGAQPQVSRLYPAVSWPVSRGTPALASHVGWDHSMEWSVADSRTTGRNVDNIIEYDLTNPSQAFIAGHDIDGRIHVPVTVYLLLVWQTVAKMKNLDMEAASVVMDNVQIRRSAIMPRDSSLQFHVKVLNCTGDFEICEGDTVVVTGIARLTDNPSSERLTYSFLDEAEDNQEALPSLDEEDIYKELHLRGYHYQGVFRGIKSSDARGTRGLLKWEGNWITFMDSVLQFGLIGMDTRELHLLKGLQRVVIDPVAHLKAAAAAVATKSTVPVNCCSCINAIVSGGIEFRGVKRALAPRRTNVQAPPKLESYTFVPLDNSCVSNEDSEFGQRSALGAALQLVLENTAVLQLSLAEPALARPLEDLMLPRAVQVLNTEQEVHVTARLAAGAGAPRYAALEPLGVQVSNTEFCSGSLADCHVVMCADALAAASAGLLRALAGTGAGFVLLDERARALQDPAAQANIADAGLTLVSRWSFASRELVLLRRVAAVPAMKVVVEVRDDDFDWVEQLKSAMKRAESSDMRVYVWSRAPGSGVQGLATCLRREAGGDRLRLYYLPGAKDAFDPDAPAYKAQVQRDLAFNVLRAGVWGTFRHLPLDDVMDTNIRVEHAHVTMLKRGDLSSLRWAQSNPWHAVAAPQRPHTDLCRVHYAALNFRDILLATGKRPPTTAALDKKDRLDCLGVEFSGKLLSGRRVMGMIAAKGLATTVFADERFLWDVPEQWSLEEAATVPVAYATAYYALSVRGRLRQGEAVLVHAGTGSVGQAAIAIALHAGCTVFTTMGTPDKRVFLRERFPQLPDANIGNSRDCSFEQLVLRRTGGQGVDLVINSLVALTNEKLQASLRCLAIGGRFLEIGKLDLNSNSAIGTAVLLKNTTVHGIMLDDLFDAHGDHTDRAEIVRCVTEGIAAGVVRPLPATVYADNQLEQAFRYMVTGSHIGKVLIRVREEEAGGKPAPARLLSAMPRTYMHPAKSYVLVGGLGGIGLELGQWMVDHGARTLVLNSRTGVRTGYQAWCIRRWREKGIRVVVSTADATTVAGARTLLGEAAAAAPVGGIFNLAAVLRDAFFENQTVDDFRAVAKPKIDATRALDEASRDLAPELEYFVAFSSGSCGRGNAGQSNYGMANSAMERLCEQRQADGLPALAVQWGVIGDVGFFITTMHGSDDTLVGGTIPQRIASCLATLGKLLAVPHAVTASAVVGDKRREKNEPTKNIVQAVAIILGITNLSKVAETATLAELGMDSLMNTEIKQMLERSCDTLLSMQEIRVLTFGKLRGMGRDAPAPAPEAANGAPAAAGGDLVQFATFGELVPKQVLVKLPSQPPNSPDDSPVFMVHPIEGVVDLLRGVAAGVRGTVYGLQCASSAPLDDMAALARFYVKHVRTAQPQPPYTLLGYSFGAGVAFEMALQLEQEGCSTRLVLVDGSPAFVASHTTRGKKKRTARTPQSDEADALAYFAQVFQDLDAAKVASELERLPDWEARVGLVTDLIVAGGARVEKDALRGAAHSFYRKLVLGDRYKPTAQLRAPVTLFKARDNCLALDEDYRLKAVCAGELRTRQLAGTHRTILIGDAAQVIAEHVSDLLARC